MATFIALVQFTDQGIRTVKDTTKRAEAAKAAAGKLGVTMREIYWTLGQYDMVTIIDAPNDEAATAFMLAVSSAGNVRGQTLRAFNGAEMNAILGKLG